MALVEAITVLGEAFRFDKLKVESIESSPITTGLTAPSKGQIKEAVQLNFDSGRQVRIRARLIDVQNIIETSGYGLVISDLEKKDG